MNKTLAFVAAGGVAGLFAAMMIWGNAEEEGSVKPPALSPAGGAGAAPPAVPVAEPTIRLSATNSRPGSAPVPAGEAPVPEATWTPWKPPAEGAAPSVPESFTDLPESYQPAAMQRAMGTMQKWIDDNHPDAEAEILGMDCSEAPCVIVLDFSRESFADEAAGFRFWQGYQEAAMGELGWLPMGDEIPSGDEETVRIFSYGVPPEVVTEGDGSDFGAMTQSAMARGQAAD